MQILDRLSASERSLCALHGQYNSFDVTAELDRGRSSNARHLNQAGFLFILKYQFCSYSSGNTPAICFGCDDHISIEFDLYDARYIGNIIDTNGQTNSDRCSV